MFSKNTTQCETYIKASQSAVVRLNKTTDPGIGGLCTDGMSACICIIFQNPNGRISLTHTDLTLSDKSMQREVEWVGSPCNVTVVRGKLYGDPAKEKQFQFRSFWIPYMENAIKNKCSSITIHPLHAESGAVAVDRNGAIVLIPPPKGKMGWVRVGRAAPMIDFRHSIVNMNHAVVNMEAGMFDLDVQYDGDRWTAFPLLYPRTTTAMLQLQQGGTAASRIKASILQQDGPMALTNFEDAVRDVRVHRERAEKDETTLGAKAMAAYNAASYQAAADLYEHCAVLANILRPGPSMEDRTALHNVGRAYMQMGDYNWGAKYMRQSLEVARQLQGSLGIEQMKKVEARLEECEQHLERNDTVTCTSRRQHP